MLVNVLAKNDLLARLHGGIEIHLKFAGAFVATGHLHAELLPGECLEIGGVAPQLLLLERPSMMQPDDQRGIDLVEESIETVTFPHSWIAGEFRTFAPIVTWED